MLRNKTIIAAVTSLVVAASTAAFASPVNVVNASFEGPTVSGSFVTAPSGTVTGWTIGNTVDLIGSYWQAADGRQSVDLSGNGPGSLSQTLTLPTADAYVVTFSMAGNTDNGPAVKTLLASLGNAATQTFTFDTTGKSHSNMGWVVKSFTVLASDLGGSSVLRFASGTNNAYGPAIDNISVQAITSVPVPSAAIGGLGLMAFAGLKKYRNRR